MGLCVPWLKGPLSLFVDWSGGLAAPCFTLFPRRPHRSTGIPALQGRTSEGLLAFHGHTIDMWGAAHGEWGAGLGPHPRWCSFSETRWALGRGDSQVPCLGREPFVETGRGQARPCCPWVSRMSTTHRGPAHVCVIPNCPKRPQVGTFTCPLVLNAPLSTRNVGTREPGAEAQQRARGSSPHCGAGGRALRGCHSAGKQVPKPSCCPQGP